MPEVSLPRDLVMEIEEDTAAYRQAKLREIAQFYVDDEVLTWRAGNPPPQAGWPTNGAGKYHGAVAEGYDAKRDADPKWIWEQGIIEGMLSELKPGGWVLDCPVGTGRLLPFYVAHGLNVHAVDISVDMLKQASERLKKCEASKYHVNVQFTQASILDLSMPPNWVDAAVMCRLTRWLSVEECQTALRNLQRIASKRIILTTRVEHQKRPDVARPIEIYQAALEGWTITREERRPGDEAYRVLMLEPA